MGVLLGCFEYFKKEDTIHSNKPKVLHKLYLVLLNFSSILANQNMFWELHILGKTRFFLEI
jgi:hypothetical protein